MNATQIKYTIDRLLEDLEDFCTNIRNLHSKVDATFSENAFTDPPPANPADVSANLTQISRSLAEANIGLRRAHQNCG